jgi:hypothetical protein
VIWTPVAAALAAAALAPAQEGSLTLANVRATYGILGPTRTDTKVMPGDSVFVSFDIEGIKPDADGTIHYAMGTEVSDRTAKVLFKQDPRDQKVPVSLGGERVAAYARVDAGLEQPAGEYTLKVTVTDRAAGKTQSLTKTFEVLPKGFALVRLSVTHDSEGLLPVVAAGHGQGVWLQFGVVGFTKPTPGKGPDVAIEMQVTDADGKPTLAKPVSAVLNQSVPENAALLPVHLPLALNRPGKFTVELTATDKASGKTAKLSFPLVVVESK